MRTLITGGAGFIGSHLVDRLLAQSDDVLVIDNFSTGRRDNLTRSSQLTVVEGTIADRNAVDRAFNDFKPDRVVHAAAAYKDPDDWSEDILANTLGTANVVLASQRAAVGRLIYFQTSLCYGIHPHEQPITLSHPVSPTSSYAISKTAAEQYIDMSGLEYISFRLANAYGPRNLSGPLPTFYQRLINGKPCFVADTRRDFVYVDDLVSVVLMALDGKGRSGPYHVSSGSDYSIKELFDATVSAMNVEPIPTAEIRPRNPDDTFTILLDPSETERDFGWKVQTPLTEGVARAISWYKAHAVTETYTHLKAVEAGK